MLKSHYIVPRLLLCPLAGIGFWLATSLARLLGGLLSAAHPVNWITDPTQMPMPVTLIVFLLLLLIGSVVGMAVMGAGCTIGAFVGGWACNLPLNCRGGYVNGRMAELVIGAVSILLAILVPLLISALRKWREKAAPAEGSRAP